MLIDLHWVNKSKNTIEFDTSGGNLSVTVQYGDQIFKRLVAEKVHTGVYVSYDLWNNIELYTDWKVEHPWTESKAIFDEMTSVSHDVEKHAKLRDRLLRIKPESGLADNLLQVFNCGRHRIRSEHPYVLEIRKVEWSDEKYVWKNGPYIGGLKSYDLDNAIKFNYHKLIK